MGGSRDFCGVFPFWWCLVLAGRGKANTYAVSYLGGFSRFDVFLRDSSRFEAGPGGGIARLIC